jgi:hypothetical protein
MDLFQKYVPEYASKIKNSQGEERLNIIRQAGAALTKKLKGLGYSGVRSPLGGGDAEYLNKKLGLAGNLISPFSSGFIPNFATTAELYSEPWRQTIRGKDRSVPSTQTRERFREYELALFNGGLQKLGFSDVEDLNKIFGSSSRADFFARKR